MKYTTESAIIPSSPLPLLKPVFPSEDKDNNNCFPFFYNYPIIDWLAKNISSERNNYVDITNNYGIHLSLLEEKGNSLIFTPQFLENVTQKNVTRRTSLKVINYLTSTLDCKVISETIEKNIKEMFLSERFTILLNSFWDYEILMELLPIVMKYNPHIIYYSSQKEGGKQRIQSILRSLNYSQTDILLCELFKHSNTPIYKAQLMCNWMLSKDICNDWKKMSKGDNKWNNLQIVPTTITPSDYYIVVNHPISLGPNTSKNMISKISIKLSF